MLSRWLTRYETAYELSPASEDSAVKVSRCACCSGAAP